MWNRRIIILAIHLWIVFAAVLANRPDSDNGEETASGSMVEEEDEEMSTEEEDEYYNSLSEVQQSGYDDVKQEDLEENRSFLESLGSPYELVYPVQVRRSQRLGIDTRDYREKNKLIHFHRTSFHIEAFNRRFRLRLELNSDLLNRGVMQKRHVDETTSVISESPVEQCYYHGYVRRLPGSLVAISTCYGLSGVIRLQNESFIIQPLNVVQRGNETRHPHVLYRSMPAPPGNCATDKGHWYPFQDLHQGEFFRRLKLMKSLRIEKDMVAEMKYLELALVVDHSMYAKMNFSYAATLNYAIQLANIMDAYYRSLRVQIHLAYVEVWNMREEFPIHAPIRYTLHEFLRYRLKTMNIVPHDMVQFVTGQQFAGGDVGLAIPDTVCTNRAVGVSANSNVMDPLQGAAVVAQMIGHVLGIKDDANRQCDCPSRTGCVMKPNPIGPLSEHPRYFSNCSDQDFNNSLLAGLGFCLFHEKYEYSYMSTCGNRILERGEECDCGSKQDCAMRDPCCDPDLCLLRPWATCRSGMCCNNCTVQPKDLICRPPLTECDVPEFCDGISGDCPVNELVQDGQPCSEGEGFCYRGLCPTYSHQCFALWGIDSVPAVDKCYEKFNPTGNFNGHCGLDSKTGLYIKCPEDHIKCGLLHCAGGEKEPPVNIKKLFSMTTVYSEGIKFQCKIVNSQAQDVPQLGLVEDGTKCDIASLCINQSCVPIANIMPHSCPSESANLTCSGHGICTSGVWCLCDREYTGDDCSVMKNITETTAADVDETTEAMNLTTAPVVRPTTATTAAPAAVLTKGGGVSTLWLIIVLASVVGTGCVILAFCTLCYRRRSPNRLEKAYKKKMLLQQVISGSMMKKDSSEETVNRIISFGNMPSYRADKMKARRKKELRQSAAASETGSEHSRSDRESAEIRVSNTLPLAKPPEKGILKNRRLPRSAENLRELGESSHAEVPPVGSPPGEERCLLKDASTQRDGSDLEAEEGDRLMALEQGESSELEDEAGSPDSIVVEGRDREQETVEQDGAESDDSCEKKSFTTSEESEGSDSDSDAKKVSSPDSGSTPSDETKGLPVQVPDSEVQHQGSQTSSGPGSQQSSVGSSAGRDSARAIRIKDLDDLIRQIDQQVSKLSKPSSPATSQEPSRHSSSSSGSENPASRLKGDSAKQAQPCSPPSPEGSNTQTLPLANRHCKPLHIQIPQSPSDSSKSLPSETPNPPYKALDPRKLFFESIDQPEVTEKESPHNRFGSPSKPSPPLRQTPPRRTPVRGVSPSSQGPPPYRSVSPSQAGRRVSPTRKVDTPLYVGSLTRRNPVPTRTSPPHQGSFGQKPIPPERVTPVKKPTPVPRASPLRTSSPDRRENASKTPQTRTAQDSPYTSDSGRPESPSQLSPRRGYSPQPSSPPISAIPYRGAKGGSLPGSPPATHRQKIQDYSSDLSGADSPHLHTAPDPPPRSSPSGKAQLTHPLLDGYPFKQSLLAAEGQSGSEGYYSDRADPDDSVIIREIPVVKPGAAPGQRVSFRKSTDSTGSSVHL